MTKPTYEELEKRLEAADRRNRRLTEKVAALAAMNELYNDVLSVSPVGIGLFDNRTFSWINKAMRRMFGYESEADYVGKTARILYASDEEFDRVGRRYSRLKAGEIAQLEIHCQRKDGSTFWGHAEMSCPDPERPMQKVIFAVSDITEKKLMEAERKEREKLRATIEMAGAVCHELNQPLQALFVYSDLLHKDVDEGSPLYNSVAMIRSQLSRISKITDRLMGLTRYETMDYYGACRILDLKRSSKRAGKK